MILVDTSAWIESTKRSGEAIRADLGDWLERDEVATTAVVIGEVLQGAKTAEEYVRWEGLLLGLRYFDAPRDVWERAARLSFELRRQGKTTALTDLVIATVAMDNEMAVYAIDTDFARVTGLDFRWPDRAS